ncbi:uncharacterized protein LOC132560082 [Ylistrum balloti]|uniref:uncharacterized protein LOC132560082 n=1 Tax=Ylistrum balloti TaxID=509963 RepID=UPI002905F4F4|nr:uncharacterized protein LOC132560082 [Ylistrum balloti]
MSILKLMLYHGVHVSSLPQNVQYHGRASCVPFRCAEKNARFHLTYQELWDAVRFHDMAQIDTWVSEGRDLFDDHHMTIYHIASQCGSVEFIEELVRRHPSTTHLILRGSKDVAVTSLHWCCVSANGKEDRSHSVGILDALCTAAGPGAAIFGTGDEDVVTWTDWASEDENLKEYITWRRYNTTGLPPEIRRLDNRSIHQYIQTFGSMGSESAQRYKQAIQGRTETSYCIRLVFLGHEGVGKTTLMLRMTDQDVSKLKPTNQLDVLLNLLIIDRISNQRKLLQPGMEQEVTRQRLRDVIVDSFLSESLSETEDFKTSDDKAKTLGTLNVDIVASRGSSSVESQTSSIVTPTTPSDVTFLPITPVSPLSPDTVFAGLPTVTPPAHTEAAIVMTTGPTEDFGQRGHKTYVSVFDFGGEMMFSTFQHIFLNTNAVILLCFSLHNCFENDAILERVYFWLKFLSTFSDGNCRYQPPVLLVGTHLDMVEESQRTTIRKEVRRKIKSDPKIARAFDRHVVEFVVIDSTQNVRSAYDGLWNLVLEAAVHQSQWGQLLPASWITLERDLMLLKGQGVKVVTLDEVKTRAKNLVVPLDERDVLAMLEYLHVIRSILSFQLENPDSRLILDPQWLIKAFRMIVTTVKFRQEGLDIDLITKYEKTRRLTLPFVDAVWTHGSVDGFMEFRDTILFYLDRLELIVKPLPKEGEASVDYYIVPCLLDEPNPDQIRPLLEQKGTIKSPTLCFEFLGRFIPPAVYNKILASCIHRFEVLRMPNQDDKLYLQQGLACFAISGRWNMVLHCRDSQMKITLFSSVVKKAEEGDGYMVRIILESIVQATMKRSQQGHLKFDYYVSDHFQVKNDEIMVKVLLTTQMTKTRSRRSLERAVWFTERKQMVKPSLSVSQSERTFLRRCPVPREIIRIAKYVGNTYTLFFGIMGMNEVRVQQLREQFEHGQRLDFLSVIARITFAWEDEFGDKANFMLVKNAFEYCGLDLTGFMEEIAQLTSNRRTFDDLGIPASIQNSRPFDDELSDICMIILKGYFIVFIELNVTIEAIELAEMDHNKALDLIRFLLEYWMEKFRDEATIRKLYFALKECKRNYTKLRGKL